MKVLIVVALSLLAIDVPRAAAQAPDGDWSTLRTEHFRVTFPSDMESLGRRAASAAEIAYAELAEAFVDPPSGRIELVVTDDTDQSNGFATIVPYNRIVVFARPPVDGTSLSYFDDWMELVITHELAHIHHLDLVRNPLGRLLRASFGRAEANWPFFPGVATPGWVIEGLATWYESDLTSAGRVRGTFSEMLLRTAILEDRFEGIGQASGESPLWPGGARPYTYGSLFFEYLLERHGREAMGDFIEALAGQWIPYRMDSAGRAAFGQSLSDAWEDWREELRARYALFDAELAQFGPVTGADRVSDQARWGFHPSVSPDGSTVVYVRADSRSDIQLARIPVAGGEEREVSRTNGLSTYGWMPDGSLLVSQLEQAGPFRSYADLYRISLDGRTERITRRARLEQPSVAPDGSWAIAVQNAGGTNALVRVDLASGGVSTLVPADPDRHWAFPRLSPDGRWIAATRWDRGAFEDVVILDARDGREVHRVTRDRAIDLAPSWSPDGRWVVWSSDRTGIMNILAAQVDPATGRAGAPRLLTNVRTAAIYPSVDPSGTTLYFSGHHVDGWEAERVPFAPDLALAAPPPSPRFTAPAPPPPATAAPGVVEDYSAWSTLIPTYWRPRIRDPILARATTDGGVSLPEREIRGYGVGLETSGLDVLSRHSWAAYAQVLPGGNEIEAGGGYAYFGLGVPAIGLSVNQVWLSGGQGLAGTNPDTVYYLTRERSAYATVAFVSARWRRRLNLTLSGGVVRERTQLLASDLEATSQYSLARPTSTLGEGRAAIGYATNRSHSFQTGDDRGLSANFQARSRRHLGLDASEVGVPGTDRTFLEWTGRVRGYVPLWVGGHATHVLAVQASGGAAYGAGAQFGHFVVGGTAGAPEALTGLELFGGSYEFLPVRGYSRATRYGYYAWSTAAEYRFPLALVNWGLGAWPLHVDRVVGSVFFDAGDAWGPYPHAGVLTSAGAEVTVGILGFFNSSLLLRTGVAVPFAGGDPEVYVRSGLAF